MCVCVCETDGVCLYVCVCVREIGGVRGERPRRVFVFQVISMHSCIRSEEHTSELQSR